MEPREQLEAIKQLDEILTRRRLEYWIFGGWAVDLHVGRMTRAHDDLDVAVWETDADDVSDTLRTAGWVNREPAGTRGYAVYTRGDMRLEVALLAQDPDGTVYTPAEPARGVWPEGSFGDDRGRIGEANARVVSIDSLMFDKSQPHGDAGSDDKDRADVAALRAVRR